MTESQPIPVNHGEPMAAASGPEALDTRNQPLTFRDRAVAQPSPQQSPMAIEPAEIEALAKDSGSGAFVDRLAQSADTTPSMSAINAPAQDDQGHPDQEPEQHY
jgi:hypothetical protein